MPGGTAITSISDTITIVQRHRRRQGFAQSGSSGPAMMPAISSAFVISSPIYLSPMTVPKKENP
ncbi:hypothetical protein BBJK_03102 [Bifidobacterium bifidum LMG 13195]|uniref:Uncharacterized protein n=1 Tax=Bifidobacterium bifidum LMG 13195 TaxID=1207542 RepID=A0A286TFE9_BIFBI|nr:hypothetical protein BBJK_03102 [Bifidobacterium bifidum LMG 13195]